MHFVNIKFPFLYFHVFIGFPSVNSLTRYISISASGESGVLRQSQPQRKRILQVSSLSRSVDTWSPGQSFTVSYLPTGLQILVMTLTQTLAERSTISATAFPVQRWRSTVLPELTRSAQTKAGNTKQKLVNLMFFYCSDWCWRFQIEPSSC